MKHTLIIFISFFFLFLSVWLIRKYWCLKHVENTDISDH